MNEKKVSVTELGNPRKPHGEAGAEMLEGMNKRHYEVTGWALDYFRFDSGDSVLDIGCGGGETVRRIAEKISDGTVWGVDYSALSVELSLQRNKENIENGKVRIIEASVEELPFDNDSFDKIITVESFYFWPDPQENLKEVYRVLREGGKFLIVSEIYGDADLDENDLEGIRKYELFNPTLAQFRELLEKAGFKNVAVHTKDGEKWVCAEGNK